MATDDEETAKLNTESKDNSNKDQDSDEDNALKEQEENEVDERVNDENEALMANENKTVKNITEERANGEQSMENEALMADKNEKVKNITEERANDEQSMENEALMADKNEKVKNKTEERANDEGNKENERTKNNTEPTDTNNYQNLLVRLKKLINWEVHHQTIRTIGIIYLIIMIIEVLQLASNELRVFERDITVCFVICASILMTCSLFLIHDFKKFNSNWSLIIDIIVCIVWLTANLFHIILFFIMLWFQSLIQDKISISLLILLLILPEIAVAKYYIPLFQKKRQNLEGDVEHKKEDGEAPQEDVETATEDMETAKEDNGINEQTKNWANNIIV